ncbi:hypothetical protein EMIT0215P_130092 [Pseudomonas serboccidentalis]
MSLLAMAFLQALKTYLVGLTVTGALPAFICCNKGAH